MTEEPTNTNNQGGDAGNGGADQNEAMKRLADDNKAMKAKIAEYEKNNNSGGGEGGGQQEPEVGSPEFIKQVIAFNNKREKAVGDFFTKHPELTEFKGEVEKRLNDPSREKVPINEIIQGAIPMEEMLKLGAKLKDAAEQGANDQRMGGGDGNTDTAKQKKEEKLAKQYASLPAYARPKK